MVNRKLKNYPEIAEFREHYIHYLDQAHITVDNWALIRTEAEAYAFSLMPDLAEHYRAYKKWYSDFKSLGGKRRSKDLMTISEKLGAVIQGAKASACIQFKPNVLEHKYVFPTRQAGCVVDDLHTIPEIGEGVVKLYVSWIATHDFIPKDDLLAHFTGKNVNTFTRLRADLRRRGYGFKKIDNGWQVKKLEDMSKEELIEIINMGLKPLKPRKNAKRYHYLQPQSFGDVRDGTSLARAVNWIKGNTSVIFDKQTKHSDVVWLIAKHADVGRKSAEMAIKLFKYEGVFDYIKMGNKCIIIPGPNSILSNP